MTGALWRCLLLWVILGVGSSQHDADEAQEGSSMGTLALRRGARASPHVVRVSAVTRSAVFSRQKRNVLFPSGVRLCAQETAQQVVANHLSYFHLRVCQETVWEAFKIFWDRLPQQEEYQSWMGRCQDGAVSARDVGAFFSQSPEHLAMVGKRMSQPVVESSEPTKAWQHMCSTPTPSSPGAVRVPQTGSSGDTQGSGTASGPHVEQSTLGNDIPLQPAAPPDGLEQVVELSLLLSGEVYSSDLDDPRSLKYQTLSRQLEDKIEDSLEGLPGFKSVSVTDFRPQKDGQGRDVVMMNYTVTVVVGGAGVSNHQLDFLTFQSNLVERSYRETHSDHHTLETMSESPESVSAPDGDTVVSLVEPPEVWTQGYDAEGKTSETVTMATAGNDVVVLEESEDAPPALELETSPREAAILEEGLLPGDAEQVPPAQSPPELPESVMLPEPPVEMDSSGSGTVDTENLPRPSAGREDEHMAAPEDAELTTQGVPLSPEAGADPLEVVDDDAEDPEEFEVSTITTEITESELLPAQVPVPDAKMETMPSHPEVPETTQIQEPGRPLVPPENATPEDPASSQENLPEPESEAPHSSPEHFSEDEKMVVNQERPLPTESSSVAHTALPPVTRADVDGALQDTAELSPPSGEVKPPSSEEATGGGHGYDVFQHGFGLVNHTEEGSTSFPFSVAHNTDQASIAMPVNPGRALMVFFSLRVTNMIFSEDLFNKSSPEYKALEQRFLELLVPYLQSNLSHFENLEILNFRNGSIVVNSRMKFGRPVAHGVTSTVYLILEDFCNTAYQTMNLAIDKYSLDVESGDQADPCKFQACNEYADCEVNRWSGEAECVCNAGYFSVDGLPCQSICELQSDFCLNDGKCDIIPGQGAICRCRVGENWWYRGEHCEEYVSEPLVVGIAIASVAGFLLVASGVIFFLARTLRDQYDKDESEDPIRLAENQPSLERATKYNPMYESEPTTGYSHYYRRYPDIPVYSSASAEASTDFSSEEIRHIYENSELTKEEIQDRIRIIELYAKDRQFADFVRHHQAALDTRRESSSGHT